MDRSKYLVMIKHEDKTEQVELVRREAGKIAVTFHGGKVYRFLPDNVEVYQHPVKKQPPEELYFHTTKLNYVSQLIQFGTYTKVFFQDGSTTLYVTADLVADGKPMFSKLDMLTYLKEIATLTTKEEPNYLLTELKKIKYIDEKSVLHTYCESISLQKPTLEKGNTIYPFFFNASQKKALENSYLKNISIIEGPPGTGKTQTILNIIANLAIMQYKTVAVVSGNNEAVKNIKDKLEKEKYSFMVADLGRMEKRKEFFSKLPQPDVREFNCSNVSIIQKKVKELDTKIDTLLDIENKMAKQSQQLDYYLIQRAHFDHFYADQRIYDIKEVMLRQETPDNIISFLCEDQLAFNKQRMGIIYRFKMFLKYGYRDKTFLKMEDILTLQKRFYELKVKQLTQEVANFKQILDDYKFEKLKKEHHYYSTLLFRKQLFDRYHTTSNQFTYTSYLKDFNNFTKAFPVVLSTTHSIRSCIKEGFLFDYIIMDESSQIDLLTGCLALSCAKNAIVVGDTKQLPQIVDDSLKKNLKAEFREKIPQEYDYFKQNILTSLLLIFKEQLPRIVLKEHYRCHPRIIEFCNRNYYHGELIPFASSKHQAQQYPISLFFTAEGNHMREMTNGTQNSKYNQREIEVMEEVLDHYRINPYKEEEIGITTPYRCQADRSSIYMDNGIQSDTIHKYQGREKQLMILSTVLDETASGRAGIRFVDDACKINVAVSRAEEQFVLITNKTLFKTAGKEVKALIDYISYYSFEDNIVQSEIVSVFDLLYKQYSNKLVSLQNRLLNRSAYRSENIIDTILADILGDNKYLTLVYDRQILLRNLFKSLDRLTEEEKEYVNHRASVDFVVFEMNGKKPLLLIEVDGFFCHENNKKQLYKDKLKDSIASKYGMDMLRLKTNESQEIARIKQALDKLIK